MLVTLFKIELARSSFFFPISLSHDTFKSTYFKLDAIMVVGLVAWIYVIY
jgi:hypothetical protein